ncbi:MAG: Crossover junction endodeoxyribonuclease RuvC [Hyphomicrobiaceae bacterium hypho_1]
MSIRAIRIIGIDPGLRCSGWGVIEINGPRLSYVASGFVTSTDSKQLSFRLKEIFEGLTDVLKFYMPCEAAVEETFVNDNARTTLKLGQARGIALLVPALCDVSVAEYSPNLIKKTVVGTGHAGKKQIQIMVKMLLPRANFSNSDEADALAVAICHAHQRSSVIARIV